MAHPVAVACGTGWQNVLDDGEIRYECSPLLRLLLLWKDPASLIAVVAIATEDAGEACRRIAP